MSDALTEDDFDPTAYQPLVDGDDEDIISDGCLIPTDEAEDDVVILQV